ncbi:MAG: tannase/feruloyl esterase family alpha/beta hydrolase [Vicinamibacterales bacterium]
MSGRHRCAAGLVMGVTLAATSWPGLPAQTLAPIPLTSIAGPVVVDADERRTDPVPHRYLHGVIPDDARFQLALPERWNGRLAVFSRGFSGTELTGGAWKTAALQKGYAFAASDEGWQRTTIAAEPEDSYAESRPRIRELTLYAHDVVAAHYGRKAGRTLMMGGSNGGHHTKWMLESHPELYDGGIAGYGFNSQVSQWGSIATVLRHYQGIAGRIDDIIAARAARKDWDPSRDALTPPLTAAERRSLARIYAIPARVGGVDYDVGRWPGSEARWKADHDGLVGYLRDSMPRFDPSFNPGGGSLTDDELPLWDPAKSPTPVQADLRGLDLTGRLTRPVIVMHGTADAIVSPGESTGYMKLVQRRLGPRGAADVLAVYFIPGMGHGGPEFDGLIGAQIDALEAWIDFRQTDGRRGSPAPAAIGGYPREIRVRR